MGCPDTIHFKCPECGADHYAQTKSGECMCAIYELDSVPIETAQDANRHSPYPCKCGKSWEICNIPELTPTITVSLKIKEAK